MVIQTNRGIIVVRLSDTQISYDKIVNIGQCQKQPHIRVEPIELTGNITVIH